MAGGTSGRSREENEASLTAKLRESDLTLEERRQAMENEYLRRQTDLQESFLNTEKSLRQDLLQKEDALRQRYQTQLIHGEAELQKRFEAMASQLGQDAESQKAILEDHRKSADAQFEQAKAALVQEMLQKEKEMARQLAVREQDLSEKYQQSMASERAAAQAQVRHALGICRAASKGARTGFPGKAQSSVGQGGGTRNNPGLAVAGKGSQGSR